jgi:transcriptional regulator with XRE-family HTH domain
MGKKPASAEFGARVLQARMLLSARVGRVVSQTEIGEMLGVTGVTIGRWEEGGREPSSLADLERLADVLEVSAAWLAFGAGVPLAGHHEGVKPMPPNHLTRVETQVRRRKSR